MRSRFILVKRPQISLNLWGGRRLAAALLGGGLGRGDRRHRRRRTASDARSYAVGRAPARHRLRNDRARRNAPASSAPDRRRGGGTRRRALRPDRRGAGAAAALWLALAPRMRDEAFREIKRPVLVLCVTKDQSDADDRGFSAADLRGKAMPLSRLTRKRSRRSKNSSAM